MMNTDSTEEKHPLIRVFMMIFGGAFALYRKREKLAPPVRKSHPIATMSTPVTMKV